MVVDQRLRTEQKFNLKTQNEGAYVLEKNLEKAWFCLLWFETLKMGFPKIRRISDGFWEAIFTIKLGIKCHFWQFLPHVR